jgi:hypothetical protein
MNNDNLYRLLELNTTSLKIPTDHLIEQKHFAEEYQCMLQSHLPYDALECLNCSSLICKSCAKDVQAMGNKCISCKEKLETKEPNPIVKKTLEKFTIKCINPECAITTRYLKYSNHYINCEYTPREAICTDCESIIRTNNKLREITEHNKDCNLKEHCKYCSKAFLAKEMNAHIKQCEEREILCPYCQDKFAISKRTLHWAKQCFINFIKKKEEYITELCNSIKQKESELKERDMRIEELERLLEEKDKMLSGLVKEKGVTRVTENKNAFKKPLCSKLTQ